MENPKINLEKKMQGNAERQSSPRIPIEIQPTSFFATEKPKRKKNISVRGPRECRENKLTTNPLLKVSKDFAIKTQELKKKKKN